MSQKLKQLKQDLEASHNKFKEETRAAFRDAVQDLFAQFPELKSFSWTQYTPYFNDGDECIFGVRSDDPDINGIDGYEIQDDRTYGTHHFPAKNVELFPAKKAVAALLGEVPDEMMKEVFGDHKRVTYTRDGVEIEDYEHD